MSNLGKTSALIATAILLLCGGMWLGGHPETLPGPVRDAFVDDDRALRAEIVDLIKDDFYRPVKDSDIDESSLKGIVEGLNDQFSNYLTPKETKQFEQSVRGEFEGVGMNVDEDRRGLQVINVFDGSPAKKAGIKKGEFIVAVNGRSIAGVSSDVATARIKGPAGTQVRLEVVEPRRGRAAHAAHAPRADRGAGGEGPDRGARRPTARAWWSSRPSARARTASCDGRSTACAAAAPRASCSTCAATAAASCARPCSCRRSSSRTA